jgi:hypothetical protein
MARAHIPRLVINLLVIFSVLTAISMGISAPKDQRVHPTHIIFFALNAASIMLVFDLDRPRIGLVQVSQRPMLELREIMRTSPAALPLQPPPAAAAALTGDTSLAEPLDPDTARAIATEQP